MDISLESGVGEQLKTAFRRHPAGLAVITAQGPDRPVGLTASSVTSVSVTPPALSFSLGGTPTARALAAAPSFVVHLLGPRHTELAREFSRVGGPRFTPEQGWSRLPTGEPVLSGAAAALRCAPLQLVPVGESTVVVASVSEVYLGSAGGRLVYHDRTFVSLPAPGHRH
ncbi:flavin reductase family protein [Rugosimonospora africana]|uniref:Flavin oxidoreductase n=1 Tax=Rugosimonospora africana TaxID=556532 RepID=A0A8J3VQH6_9ACTN|nr:flavin reductase family protein [Rugosimonospora africana]GIH15057.1 flavin oxidoreductase [Rugosimonospora africana]